MNIPQEYLCAISFALMKNPVSLQCGHTFDKENLDKWLTINNNCPNCRLPITSPISVNWSLKSLIDKLNDPNFSNNNQLTSSDQKIISNAKHEINIDSLNKIVATYQKKNSLLNLRLKVPNFPINSNRRPVSFVCIIDVSGSMGSNVGVGEGGKAFTRLDLVKHVLNVLITSLEEFDTLALISFSNEAKVEVESMNMTEHNKKLFKTSIQKLAPDSNTHTAPAIQLAYDLIKTTPPDNVKSIILLTDGQDTEGADMLQRKFNIINKGSQIQFNTFGFSSDINSDCLAILASKGGGIFGYIPDQTMIGTIFIDFIANTFQIFAQDLIIQLDEGYEFLNKRQFETCDLIKTVLKYDATRHFMIKTNNKQNESISSFKIKIGLKPDMMIEVRPQEIENNFDFEVQEARCKLLEFLQNPKLPNVIINDSTILSDFKINEILAEFKQLDQIDPNNEQIKLAISNWNTWGAHYLRSFVFSHLFEQSLNFKSPSMKIYRSENFNIIVDKLTDLFCTLPPPKPTGICFDYTNNNNKTVKTRGMAPIRMNLLMDRNNGCILESCKVKTKNTIKNIIDLKKGDILENGSKVVCIIKSKYSGLMVKLNNLIITPYHPVYFEEKWQFPIEIVVANMKKDLPNPYFSFLEGLKSKTVCNIVVEGNHVVNCEEIICVTLGHGFTEEVVKHDFYGTNKVIEYLSSLNGWNEGCIELDDYNVERDDNGLVSKITNITYT